MCAQGTKKRVAVILAVLAVTFTALTAVEAAEEVDYNIKARAVSLTSISRAAADLVDIRITRFTPDTERNALVKTLVSEGNHALAAALGEQDEAGWVGFDPRGGGGPGRDPRKRPLRYAREIVDGDTREVILITNEYVGYGSRGQAADGAKLAQYPISFVLLKFQKGDDGEWKKGIGRMFVGAKIRFDSAGGKFVIDEFPTDPVYLKDVTLK